MISNLKLNVVLCRAFDASDAALAAYKNSVTTLDPTEDEKVSQLKKTVIPYYPITINNLGLFPR